MVTAALKTNLKAFLQAIQVTREPTRVARRAVKKKLGGGVRGARTSLPTEVEEGFSIPLEGRTASWHHPAAVARGPAAGRY